MGAKWRPIWKRGGGGASRMERVLHTSWRMRRAAGWARLTTLHRVEIAELIRLLEPGDVMGSIARWDALT